MKKIISIAAVLMIALTATMLTSCTKETTDTLMRFSLTIERTSYLGNDDVAYNVYTADVLAAYCKALGMKEGEDELILTSGEYKAKCNEMKSKFDAAQLPKVPEISGTYTLVIVLYGSDISVAGNVQLDKIASKTFTNEQ